MKKIISVILIVIIVLTIAGCSKENREEGTYKIAVLNGPTAITMAKLFENNNIDEYIDVEIDVVPTPDLLLPKLLSGEYDFAQVPTNLASILYNKGAEYKMSAITLYGVMYGVTSRDDINSIDDLKGEKIYTIGQGTTPDIIFNYLMKNIGVSKDEYEVDYSIPKTELAKAIISENVEIAIVPEPFVTMTALQNKNIKIFFDMQKVWKDQAGIKLPQTALITQNDVEKKDRDRILNAIEESIEYVLENPDKAAKIIGELETVTLTESAVNEAIPRLNLGYEEAIKDKETILKYLEILYEYNKESIGGKIPSEEIFAEK